MAACARQRLRENVTSEQKCSANASAVVSTERVVRDGGRQQHAKRAARAHRRVNGGSAGGERRPNEQESARTRNSRFQVLLARSADIRSAPHESALPARACSRGEFICVVKTRRKNQNRAKIGGKSKSRRLGLIFERPEKSGRRFERIGARARAWRPRDYATSATWRRCH